MGKSKIEWTDYRWNPVTGCDKVSEGCRNCYAGRLAETRLKHLPQYRDGFYGNVQMHPHKLDEPLRWKKPRMVFVNSMSDLFHENIPFHFIDRVMTTIKAAEQHTFQILTKRPERAVDYFNHADELYSHLDNVWLGVSVENQHAANERIPELLQTPAAVRFVSAEPLLGAMRLDAIK